MKTLNKSVVVEAALAALFAAAFVVPAMAQDAAPKGDGSAAPAPTKKAPSKKSAAKVHCFGINSCKGKSECAVDGKSSCSGKNACKGQGWISVSSAKKCTTKKGTVLGGGKDAAAPTNPAPTPAPASTPASK